MNKEQTKTTCRVFGCDDALTFRGFALPQEFVKWAMFFKFCAYLITRLVASICFRSEANFKVCLITCLRGDQQTKFTGFYMFYTTESNVVDILISSRRSASVLVPVPGNLELAALPFKHTMRPDGKKVLWGECGRSGKNIPP